MKLEEYLDVAVPLLEAESILLRFAMAGNAEAVTLASLLAHFKKELFLTVDPAEIQ
jgi:hypothetical protein